MKIVLELTLDEVNILIIGLGKLPLEQSIVVFSKVKKQAEDQLKKVEDGTKTDSERT